MFDYHVHSGWSFDAEGTLASIADAAEKAGLSEICFTEHIEPCQPYGLDWDGFIAFEEYAAEISRAAALHPGLIIRTGLELGLSPETLPQIRRYMTGKKCDFIVASQHIIRGLDPYDSDYFEHKTKKQAESLYLQELIKSLRGFKPYSVVGHIGYVDKRSPYHSPLRYSDHSDLIDEILREAIVSGHGIEINTSSFENLGVPMPPPDIVGRYLELGGEIITIGSDAHQKQQVGSGFDDALEMLRSLGARYVCTFKDMKPIFRPIDRLSGGRLGQQDFGPSAPHT